MADEDVPDMIPDAGGPVPRASDAGVASIESALAEVGLEDMGLMDDDDEGYACERSNTRP